MTAELAVMNKHGVALAADSAASVVAGQGTTKVSFVDKIFGLSTHHPVGIMIYGSSQLLGVPWETIVKLYREQLGTKDFPHLQDYAEDFLTFLASSDDLFPERQQEKWVNDTVAGYLRLIRTDVTNQVDGLFEEQGTVAESEIKAIVREVVREHYAWWRDAEMDTGWSPESYDELSAVYTEAFTGAVDAIFGKLPLTRRQRDQLVYVAKSLIAKLPPDHVTNADYSGLVIAGFGSADIFPKVRSVAVDGLAMRKLKYRIRESESAEISFENLSAVIAFAQREMVHLFMEGVDARFLHATHLLLDRITGEYPSDVLAADRRLSERDRRRLERAFARRGPELQAELSNALTELRRQIYSDPVVGVVSILPKSDLATMAETLVNLTAFKRRVTMQAETVGGPIDVAVISRGDGFVWVRKKHYFDSQLNPHFMARYNRR